MWHSSSALDSPVSVLGFQAVRATSVSRWHSVKTVQLECWTGFEELRPYWPAFGRMKSWRERVKARHFLPKPLRPSVLWQWRVKCVLLEMPHCHGCHLIAYYIWLALFRGTRNERTTPARSAPEDKWKENQLSQSNTAVQLNRVWTERYRFEHLDLGTFNVIFHLLYV